MNENSFNKFQAHKCFNNLATKEIRGHNHYCVQQNKCNHLILNECISKILSFFRGSAHLSLRE